MIENKVFLLKCATQTYAWGKLGSTSKVATLSKSADATFELEEATPYAELWMGTHAKGPSVLVDTGESLSSWLGQHPECLGSKVKAAYPTPGQLPYLFKVLSVNKALSIQAHPTKSLAERLHADKPDKYPDSNHKPEMAIALTQFEGLCGFRPKQQIVDFMKNVPEFGSIFGESLIGELENCGDEKSVAVAVQKCFTVLMTCDSAVVEEKLASLISRIQKYKSSGEDTSSSLGELFLRIHGQFPADVGCFVIYFLNHMILQPGEAMFLEANLPHAYLSGDCMECMACSDNVVRAGLTPKFKDVPILCSMLNYTCKNAKENLFTPHPHPQDKCITVFNPPVPDFAVHRIQLAEGRHKVSAVESASIIIVISGEATGPVNLQCGAVLFVAANLELDLQVTSDGMLMFRAYCDL